MIEVPEGIVPLRDLTTAEILYGSRNTSIRYEILAHNTTTGRDTLAGELDGVRSGSLDWQSNASVKKSGSLSVVDLEVAAEGKTRIADLNLVTARIRPVRVVEGLPEMPLGTYLVTAAPEGWAGTHREFSIELHERTTAIEQDAVEVTFTAETGTPVLSIVKTVINSAGEAIDVDLSDARELASAMVWEAGTSKLTIVNDLLNALGYISLWMDGTGALRATRYVKPVERPLNYEVLNDEDGFALARELTDGDLSIYLPDWTRDRDHYGVPNKVVAVASGTGDTPPLSGVATNEDATSPFSYQARGNRWIVRTLTGVEVPDYSAEVDPDAATEAFLAAKALQSLIAATSIQATVEVKCLPIPLELLDAIRFASTPAGIDARHTIVSAQHELRFDGLTTLELREVIDL